MRLKNELRVMNESAANCDDKDDWFYNMMIEDHKLEIKKVEVVPKNAPKKSAIVPITGPNKAPAESDIKTIGGTRVIVFNV